MAESRDYSKRDRKKRGVHLSAIEQLKQARSGQAKAFDHVKVSRVFKSYQGAGNPGRF